MEISIYWFSDAALLVRGCNQLGQFLSHRETNLRYLALESLCLLATSEFSHESVKKHQETVINALKARASLSGLLSSAKQLWLILFSLFSPCRLSVMCQCASVPLIFCTPCAIRATQKKSYRKCWITSKLLITQFVRKWWLDSNFAIYHII